MKHLLLIPFLLVITTSSKAQVKDSVANKPVTIQNEVFSAVEDPAEPVGGMGVFFMDYIKKNLIYPDQAKKDDVKGRVVVTFIV